MDFYLYIAHFNGLNRNNSFAILDEI